MVDPAVLDLFQCAACGHDSMRAGESWEQAAVCPACRSAYPLRDGILDTLQRSQLPALRIATQVLQLRLVISIYERYWRPTLCRIVTRTRFRDEARIVAEMIDIGTRRLVLDIGGGTGLFARHLARALPSGHVVCLDISAAMLRKARALAREEGLANMTFVRGDVARLPFRSGAFDGVNCCGALHLFNDIPGALGEIERCMQTGGRFSCLTFTRGHHPVTRSVFGAGRRLIGMEFFEPSELRGLLDRARLRNYHAETHGLMVIFGVSK